ncbi:response regulator transcription factor [Ectopseudomonas oleovorans]|jgi:two-component system response regulator PfeR|uniref:Putative transcriptional regulator ycf27 n=1 Tax=Ectopseudomonas oleovorans (strain CECT 5344) TaxID=1182590 RepID=W6QVY3_ECTO5|nr:MULTISPECIES: response regulator transcription factor [Pseudomonas]CDR90775.1 putative transcriptional regulator ycf27 [Pseudomonas oleovorans]MDH0624322.1 response regulator transcription factor [Pseudomonas chengduensis]MDH1211647.1 response regulator transcription factor [Pseudomonas chengduensis]MDH1666441.1 response regulator transcription factor [Pseudomonas chengduensis]MDH1681486.1 response regulator transcription factor [Pseudomonas chengduensis]
MNASSASPTRILAVEDDPLLASHLQSHLMARGFDVTLSHDGSDGLRLAENEDFDLILMDILLPGTNGLVALQQLRQRRSVPVLLMSALGDEQNRIAGFSQGADDYLPKPFSLGELSVRVDAILRRVAYERREPQSSTEGNGLQFDEGRSDVAFRGTWVGLTPSEYRVLELLWRHKDEALSKPFLYQQALRRAYAQHDRSLDMHVSHIRRKLQAVGYEATRVDTVWGKGYILTQAGA